MTNKGKQKEKLTDLIIESVDGCARHWAEIISDHLLDSGNVIVTPCKVGDTVYVISSFADDNVHTGVVERMCIDEEGTEIIIVGNDWFVDAIGVCRSPSDFGKTVFLTREEAVAALERMQK